MRYKNKTLLLLSISSLVLFISTLAYFIITNSVQAKSSTYNTAGSQEQSLTIIAQKQLFKNSTDESPPELLAKKRVDETFNASTDNLGIIAIPFNAYNKSINDTIVFRIKETGSKNWYFKSTYKTDQFQTNVSFPFGFPIISDSKNKSYTFELESVGGKPGNALSLSKTKPFFITKYKFSKSELQNDPSKLLKFIVGKTGEQLSLMPSSQFLLLFISLLAPFGIYYLYRAVRKKPNKLNYLVNGLLLIMILHLFAVAVAEIGYLYPREYRDGALIDIANQFATGSNPFTIINALPHTYLYGFISPLMAAFFSNVFNTNIPLTQHIITFVCMILLCFIVGKEIFASTKNISLVLMSLVIVLLYNIVSFRPEALGILLTIFTLYFVNNKKILNVKKILLLSVSIVILFYIKQYFIILFPVLVIYFLFNQPKMTLLYFIVTSLLIGIVSVFIVDKIFPIYFSNTFFNYLSIASTSWTDWMIQQSVAFVTLNWLLVILFVALSLIGFVKNMDIRFNVTDINKPLFKLPETPLSNVYFIYTFFAIVCLTLKLGNNGGAFLSYYTQLLPIPMTIFCLTYLHTTLKKYRLHNAILLGVVILFVVQHYTYLSLPAMEHTEDRLAWNKTLDFISQHNPQQGYLTPTFAISAVEKGWPMSDNGHTEYYGLNALGFAMPPGEGAHLTPRLTEWQRDVDYKIANKKYSFIIRGSGGHIKLDYLSQYYVLKQTVDVPTLGASEFWVPK